MFCYRHLTVRRWRSCKHPHAVPENQVQLNLPQPQCSMLISRFPDAFQSYWPLICYIYYKRKPLCQQQRIWVYIDINYLVIPVKYGKCNLHFHVKQRTLNYSKCLYNRTVVGKNNMIAWVNLIPAGLTIFI